MDLDDLLARSAPTVAPRSTELDDDLRAMARASRLRSRPRRPVRIALGAGIAAGVLGLGTVGAAAVINDGVWWSTNTSSGESCELEFAVQPVGAEHAAPVGAEHAASGERAVIMDGRTAWPSASEQDTVAEAARQYLASYDYDAVDRNAAIAEFDAVQRRVIAEADPGEAQPLLTGDDLEMHAVSRKVVRDLTAHLEGLGLDPHVVVTSIGSTGGCAG